MAAADYRLCDVCGGKAFYDANLNYDATPNKWVEGQVPYKEVGQPDEFNDYLDYLGDWAVICKDCAKIHKTQIVPLVSKFVEQTNTGEA